MKLEIKEYLKTVEIELPVYRKAFVIITKCIQMKTASKFQDLEDHLRVGVCSSN
jgi:maleate cis-trans isomerase